MKLVRIFLMLVCLTAGFSGCAMLQDNPDKVEPQYPKASELYAKALSFYERGRYAKARDLFHQFIGQYPDSVTFKAALYELAHCYQLLGETKQALALFNRLVTSYGDQDFWGAQAMGRIKQINEESL